MGSGRKEKGESRMIPRYFGEEPEGRMEIPSTHVGKAEDGACLGEESDWF